MLLQQLYLQEYPSSFYHGMHSTYCSNRCISLQASLSNSVSQSGSLYYPSRMWHQTLPASYVIYSSVAARMVFAYAPPFADEDMVVVNYRHVCLDFHELRLDCCGRPPVRVRVNCPYLGGIPLGMMVMYVDCSYCRHIIVFTTLLFIYIENMHLFICAHSPSLRLLKKSLQEAKPNCNICVSHKPVCLVLDQSCPCLTEVR